MLWSSSASDRPILSLGKRRFSRIGRDLPSRKYRLFTLLVLEADFRSSGFRHSTRRILSGIHYHIADCEDMYVLGYTACWTHPYTSIGVSCLSVTTGITNLGFQIGVESIISKSRRATDAGRQEEASPSLILIYISLASHSPIADTPPFQSPNPPAAILRTQAKQMEDTGRI